MSRYHHLARQGCDAFMPLLLPWHSFFDWDTLSKRQPKKGLWKEGLEEKSTTTGNQALCWKDSCCPVSMNKKVPTESHCFTYVKTNKQKGGIEWHTKHFKVVHWETRQRKHCLLLIPLSGPKSISSLLLVQFILQMTIIRINTTMTFPGFTLIHLSHENGNSKTKRAERFLGSFHMSESLRFFKLSESSLLASVVWRLCFGFVYIVSIS